jgi:hypothetical protein
MTWQDLIENYTVTDPLGGRRIKVTITPGQTDESIYTQSDPNGGRYIKVVLSGGGTTTIVVVGNYYELPMASTVPNSFYWCENSVGTPFIGALWGGAYYPVGLYYSNGMIWQYMDTPAQATQAEVDAGIVTDRWISPDTFANAQKWNDVTINLETNGTPNGDQNLLNLVEGTNMTITDDGLGNITFDATGGSGGILHATASGTDTYTATITGVTAYNDADSYLIRFTNGNTIYSPTLNINGLGAVNLYRNNNGPLIGGDIVSGGEMLVVYNSTLNVFQCIGTAPNTLFGYITNGESTTITRGQPVYAFSGTGDRMVVKLANNTSDATSAQTIGLVYSDSIAANQKGFIIIQGLLDGLSILPTATWTDGDAVYLGNTSGAITPTKPFAPNHLVYLGVVTTASNGSSGRMYVRVQNGYEMQELHNVQAQSPADNSILIYDTADSQWKAQLQPVVIQLACSDETTALTTGTAKITFRMPYAMTLSAVRASLTTAQSAGSIFTVDINENGASILSTKLTIDNTETTSVTAATPPVISDTSLADDAVITVDIDQIGTSGATGLKVTLIGTRVS